MPMTVWELRSDEDALNFCLCYINRNAEKKLEALSKPMNFEIFKKSVNVKKEIYDEVS